MKIELIPLDRNEGCPCEVKFHYQTEGRLDTLFVEAIKKSGAYDWVFELDDTHQFPFASFITRLNEHGNTTPIPVTWVEYYALNNTSNPTVYVLDCVDQSIASRLAHYIETCDPFHNVSNTPLDGYRLATDSEVMMTSMLKLLEDVYFWSVEIDDTPEVWQDRIINAERLDKIDKLMEACSDRTE
jgi:hypothetical protein